MIVVTGRETDEIATTLTVRIPHTTDPDAILADLTRQDGPLWFALMALADPDTAGAPALSGGVLAAYLGGAGTIAGALNARIDRLRVIARDRDGWSWGEISDALGEPRATTRRRAVATRRFLADSGAWWDRDGFHHETPAVAAAIAGFIERHGGVGDGVRERFRFTYDPSDGHVYRREPWTAPDGTEGEDLFKMFILPHQMP